MKRGACGTRHGGLLPIFVLAASCNGTTGYELVNFYAAASGPAAAVAGQTLTFDSGTARVTLSRATLHVGALYLTQSVPQAGGGPAPCALPGTLEGAYVGQVRGGGDVDLLDPSAQALSVTGEGSTIPAATGQVWLMHGDVNAANDPLPLLTIQGTFEEAGQTHTFFGEITIDASRQATTTNTALPGEHPICQSRIVSGIPVDVTLAQAGTLRLQVDPRSLFNGVLMAMLPDCPADTPPGGPAERCFTNGDDEPSFALFKNLTATGPYRFEWFSPG
jgi:hypothetical protein